MKKKIKFSIRIKLLILISSVALIAIVTYLALAIKMFKDDKTVLVYELNAGNVRTISAEIKAELLKVTDKIKLLTQGYKEKEWVKTILKSEKNLISYSLFQTSSDGSDWVKTVTVYNSEYLKPYNLTPKALENIRNENPIPFRKVLARQWLAINSTPPEGPPILTLAVALKISGDKVGSIAVVDMPLDNILKQFRESGIATVYLINQEGSIIAHPEYEKMISKQPITDVPIINSAMDSKFGLETKRFYYHDEWWLGAFSDVGVAGLKIISQVKEKEVFRAAGRLINKSLLFGLLIISFALFLSSRLAKNLTDPLNQLALATEKVTRWEFGDTVQIKTNDEVGQLASSFNTMSVELKRQRSQIDKHQAELEQKVRDRTADLEKQKKITAEAHEALVRTTRLASLGELAGVAAHEVLNPLNNINIRIEKMRSKFINAEAEDMDLLEKIIIAWKKAYQSGGWDTLFGDLTQVTGGGKTALEEDLENLGSIINDSKKRHLDTKNDYQLVSHEMLRITKIIDNMRSLSRVEGERSVVSMKEVVNYTITAMSDLLEKYKVKIETTFPSVTEDKISILANKDEIVQIFSNLIRNSIQSIVHAKRQAGLIELITSSMNNKVEILIKDNGIGIPEEHVNRIFEPNFTTKSAAEGTGIGLSISRRLVRAFSGDITVFKNEPGSGVVFLISFPNASAASKIETIITKDNSAG